MNRLRRICYAAANVLGIAVILLILFDPDRPLLLIVAMFGAAVVLAILPAMLPRE